MCRDLTYHLGLFSSCLLIHTSNLARGLLTPGNEGVLLSGLSTEGRNQSDYLETGVARSGDYSDIDDKTYSATGGQYSSLHTTSPGGLLRHRNHGQPGRPRLVYLRV